MSEPKNLQSCQRTDYTHTSFPPCIVLLQLMLINWCGKLQHYFYDSDSENKISMLNSKLHLYWLICGGLLCTCVQCFMCDYSIISHFLLESFQRLVDIFLDHISRLEPLHTTNTVVHNYCWLVAKMLIRTGHCPTRDKIIKRICKKKPSERVNQL